MSNLHKRDEWVKGIEVAYSREVYDHMMKCHEEFGGLFGWLCIAYAECECPGIWEYIAGWCEAVYKWNRELTINALKLAARMGS